MINITIYQISADSWDEIKDLPVFQNIKPVEPIKPELIEPEQKIKKRRSNRKISDKERDERFESIKKMVLEGYKPAHAIEELGISASFVYYRFTKEQKAELRELGKVDQASENEKNVSGNDRNLLYYFIQR